MNKTTIWYAFVVLVIYFTLVFCEETPENTDTQIMSTYANMDMEQLLSTGRDLLEVEGRTRRHRHRLWYRHLWPLAIAYWIKVKVVIVSFFVGSAIYLGFRYLWPRAQRCHQEIILDHPPPSFSHDHIPYSLEHHHEHEHYDAPSFDSSPSYASGPSFEPYSAYSGYSSSSDISSDIHSDSPVSDISAPSGPSSVSDTRRRGKRSVESVAIEDNVEVEQDENVEIIDEEISESVARQQPAEEQIAEFMFAFLGLDSKACRRRFVCEMEFRSKLNPLTSMAFRIVGRGFFEQYTNGRNPHKRATNFFECATVNPECVFVEPETASTTEPEAATEATEPTTNNDEENAVDSENEQNLEAERRFAQAIRRRGDRKLSSLAEHILTHYKSDEQNKLASAIK